MLNWFLAVLMALGNGGCSMLHRGSDVSEIVPTEMPGANPQVALQQYEEEIVGQPQPEMLPPGPEAQPAGELRMVSLPRYRVEPPDVLLIFALGMVPKTPYELKPQDVLQVWVAGTPPEQPIAGNYVIEGSGVVNLGPAYGAVRVAGKTTEEASDEIARHLSRTLLEPQVAVTVMQMAGQQDIAGEHIVGPDGRINLGAFGGVRVTGMTLEEAKAAIEEHLSQYLESPRISLDVYSYNSKVYYVITSGAGAGDVITALPITGNDTVLGALSRVGGMNQITVTGANMWIARPSPCGTQCDQILPIDYDAIAMGGSPDTNYQLFPNDRLYVSADPFVVLDQKLGRIFAPVERVLGPLLFGAQTIQTLQRFPRGNQNSNF